MMEKNSLEKWIIVATVGIVSVIFAALFMYSTVTARMRKHTQELFDELNKNLAIIELSELKGRVEEIQYLNCSSVANPEMEKKFKDELDEIIEFEKEHNKYLKDFKILVEPGSIDAICEQILQQINKKVNDIL